VWALLRRWRVRPAARSAAARRPWLGSALPLTCSLRAAPAFTALLFVIAVLGKVVGCYVGAFAGRFSHREALAVGTGMVSRGEVAIVIAVLGRNSNVISDTVFTASIVVTLLTTLTAPLLLRFTLPGVSNATDAAGIAPQRMALVQQLEQLQG
jgi:Kef-type K+ transport system membrane component KefB